MTRPPLADLGASTFGDDGRLALWQGAEPISWLRLKIDGFQADTAAGPLLVISNEDGTVSEFATAVRVGGGVDAMLDLVGLVPRDMHLALAQDQVCASLQGVRIDALSKAQAAWRIACAEPRQAWEVIRLRVAGRKVRARNRLSNILSVVSSRHYERWLKQVEPIWQQEVRFALCDTRVVSAIGRMGVVILKGYDDEASERTRRCLIEQGLDDDAIRIIRDRDTLGEMLLGWEKDWTWFVEGDDLPAAGAVAHLGAAIADAGSGSEAARPRMIYGDHDYLDAAGRRVDPQFCPHWNQEFFLARRYFRSVLIERSAIIPDGHQVGDGVSFDQLVLNAAQQIPPLLISHLPRVLVHQQRHRSSSDRAWCKAARGLRRQTIADHLQPEGGDVRLDDYGNCRVIWPLPVVAPRVSLIVPTRDRLDLLRPCIDSLLNFTDYPDFEIIIADNDSHEPVTLSYFEQLEARDNVRVVACPGPFNFAAINNHAAQAARGSVLGFINNDIEVPQRAGSDQWLREMVGWALRANVGAVGARLIYPNALVQHGGVILGGPRLAGHAHRFHAREHAGYMLRLQCHQEFSAVTAACLVVERDKFHRIGGFDADHFAVAFNDVDLCLRLRALGYKTIWTPYAELVHKETASRPLNFSSARTAQCERESRHLRQRWGDIIAADPCYSEHLTRDREDFTF